MSDNVELAIRAELGEIVDKLHNLPNNAFAQRGDLRARKDELTRELAGLNGDAADEIRERWSQRAGTKPDPQYHIEQVIPSPGEGGASGW